MIPTASLQDKETYSRLAVIAVAVAVLSLVACAGPSSPVAPSAINLWMAGAQISVAGTVVNGMTMNRGQMTGESTFFQGTLMGPSGPVTGETAQVQYRVPHGPGMMFGQGLITLYDDGTHGDPTPGDGIYCFEDTEGQFGFHMPHAPFGQYHYEFFGIHHDGEHTNHMEVAVTIVSQ